MGIKFRGKFGFRFDLAKGILQPGIGGRKMIFAWKLEMNYAKKHNCSLIVKSVWIVISQEFFKKDLYGRGHSQKGSQSVWENGGRL